jgi:hypothetical protein
MSELPGGPVPGGPQPGGPVPEPPLSPGVGLGMGALRDTRRIVAGVVRGADKAAERAHGLADRLGDDRDRMLIALGGGPPKELREAGALNRDAVIALDEAAAALRDATSALRSFAARATD